MIHLASNLDFEYGGRADHLSGELCKPAQHRQGVRHQAVSVLRRSCLRNLLSLCRRWPIFKSVAAAELGPRFMWPVLLN